MYKLLNAVSFDRELQGLAGIVRDILPRQHQSGIGRKTRPLRQMKSEGQEFTQ